MSKPTSKYINGDCYQAAGRILMNNPHTKEFVCPVLVHGTVTGTSGPHAGERFDHAWVEIPYINTESGMVYIAVIDRSNGRDMSIPDFLYYAIGKIDRSQAKTYNIKEANKLFCKTLSYGPWEGK